MGTLASVARALESSVRAGRSDLAMHIDRYNREIADLVEADTAQVGAR